MDNLIDILKALIFALLGALLGLVLFGLYNPAHAAEADAPLLSPRLDHLSLNAERFLVNREPMTPDIEMHDYVSRLALDWDVGLVGPYLLWRNTIEATSTQSQFQTVSWQFQLAVPLVKGVEFTYSHKSQHVLDSEERLYVTPDGEHEKNKFPVRDSFGLKFTFYQR